MSHKSSKDLFSPPPLFSSCTQNVGDHRGPVSQFHKKAESQPPPRAVLPTVAQQGGKMPFFPQNPFQAPLAGGTARQCQV